MFLKTVKIKILLLVIEVYQMKKYKMLLLFLSLLITFFTVRAVYAICVLVKIEILQELTFERQGFDARLKINNAGDTELSSFGVNVIIRDEDGNDATSKFFVTVSDKEGLTGNPDGSGVVPGGTNAVVHWLIIPSPGAGGDNPNGVLYYCGAKLSYTLNGEHQEMELDPDTIIVKPMPLLTVDYFMPQYVQGDDPHTDFEEPPVPYLLGVRVKNNGHGTAKDLKIDSAQPKIVENESGLLIDFKIIGTQVNGKPVPNSLLVEMGDVEPSKSTVAGWWMISTLTGEYIELDVSFTHADELGGELTSLMEATNAHYLIKDVLVDLPGRDDQMDFLATEKNILDSPLMVYESDSLEMAVTDVSESAVLGQFNNQEITLECSLDPGPIFVKLDDPAEGNLSVGGAVRSDGKLISKDNVWIRKEFNIHTLKWIPYLCLFDINSTGSYRILYHDPATDDTDRDGMPDAWESAHGFNPRNPADANYDTDGDGFTNLQEYKAGTDPRDPDSHPGVLEVTPASLNVTLMKGETKDETLTISNLTDSSLNYAFTYPAMVTMLNDPTGDVNPGLSTKPLVDIARADVGFNWYMKWMRIRLTFTRSVIPELIGYVYLDTDADPATGKPGMKKYYGDGALGYDYLLNYFSAGSQGAVIVEDASGVKGPLMLSGDFSNNDTVFTVDVPMSVINNADGHINLGMLLGNTALKLDVAPDTAPAMIRGEGTFIPWLRLAESAGNLAAFGDKPVTVTFDARKVNEGSYTDHLTVEASGPIVARVDVPVTLTVHNDAARAIQGSVSGRITGGVTIELYRIAGCTETLLKTTVTDEKGNYGFYELADGSYTVQATKQGVTFTPEYYLVDIPRDNQDYMDFTAQ
jgi:hypothetical protein